MPISKAVRFQSFKLPTFYIARVESSLKVVNFSFYAFSNLLLSQIMSIQLINNHLLRWKFVYRLADWSHKMVRLVDRSRREADSDKCLGIPRWSELVV
jgi:hypothetical protein